VDCILARKYGVVKVDEVPSGGIRIVGKTNINHSDIKNLLYSYRIYNAILRIEGDVTIDDIEDYILGIRTIKRGVGLVLHNSKVDVYGISRVDSIEHIGEFNKSTIIEHILKDLDLIRIFTRHYKDEPLGEPIILRRGAKVIDLAEKIHSDLKDRVKYAVVYRGNMRMKVSLNFTLKDMDIITLYT